jgi:hypothetical protein
LCNTILRNLSRIGAMRQEQSARLRAYCKWRAGKLPTHSAFDRASAHRRAVQAPSTWRFIMQRSIARRAERINIRSANRRAATLAAFTRATKRAVFPENYAVFLTMAPLKELAPRPA